MEGGFDLNIPFDPNEYDIDDAIPLEGVGESPDRDSVPNTTAATVAAAAVIASATGAEGSTGPATDPGVVDTIVHGAAEGGVEFVGVVGGDGLLLDAAPTPCRKEEPPP